MPLPTTAKGSRLASARPMTGSRLATARPGTRQGAPPGTGALASNIKVDERPMTQQGLTGVKTGGLGPHRQVQDASYYTALLRSKLKELQQEISRLEDEEHVLNQENATYLTFEKRAENLASQLKEKQGELSDYNLLIDKLNTNTEVEDIKEECARVKKQNDREIMAVEIMFGEKHDKESAVSKLELEIRREKEATNKLLESLDPSTQRKYMEIKEASFELQQQGDTLQAQLDQLTAKEIGLKEELESTPLKLKAFEINSRIQELLDKKNALQEEMDEEAKLSPEEEKEKHLNQVKEDNVAIAEIEKKLFSVKTGLTECQEEMARLEESVQDQDSDQAKKYKELLKREEQIDEYLNKHNDIIKEETENRSIYEDNIVKLLEAISTGLSRAQMLPTVTDFNELRADLEFKTTEAERAQATLESLTTDKERLRKDFERLEQLEQKIMAETKEIKDSIAQMNSDIEKFSDVERLKQELREKEVSLNEEKEYILENRDSSARKLEGLEEEYEALKKAVEGNDTYTQLTNLQKKWQFLEQNVGNLKEAIARKADETDYVPMRTIVVELANDFNVLLQQHLAKNAV